MSDGGRGDGKGHGRGHHGQGHGRGSAGDHGHGAGHRHDRHGNPEDFGTYLERLEDPERLAWQKPDEVVAALGIAPGAVVCDLGVGPGYFAIPMARAVGPDGRVHAIDVEPRMLELLERRARDAGISNIRPRLAPDGEALPPEPCDLVLMVNAYHHLQDGPATLRRLAGALTPRGRIAVIDFHGGECPVGPPPEHKVSREQFLTAVAAAGLRVDQEPTFLPYQYFFVLRPAAA